MTEQQEPFESWAILELMGHRRLGGFVREVAIAGSGMLRIDIPETDTGPAATQLYAPAALYAITPTTEAIARAVAARNRPEPVQRWELAPAIEAPKPRRYGHYPNDQDDDPYDGDPDDEEPGDDYDPERDQVGESPDLLWLAPQNDMDNSPFHAVLRGDNRARCGVDGPWQYAGRSDGEDLDAVVPSEPNACGACWQATQPLDALPFE